MHLDWNQRTKCFVLSVPRAGADLQDLMNSHGLDFSLSASSAQTAVLFTRELHAATAFAKYATPAALAELQPILANIQDSWSVDGPKIRCPADRDLWPFQRASVAYALARPNSLIGDQPGLGKTPAAICFCNEIRAQKVLVICPASIRLQWALRIREWTTMRWPYVVHPILHGRHGVKPAANWTIVSYDLARTEAIGKALAKERWDVVVLDEAHYLKAVDSERTRAVFGGGANRLFEPLARDCRILALTGTPLPNRPREAYTLARGMCFDSIDWMSEDRFKERFNPSRRIELGDGRFAVDERSGRHAELQSRLRSYFMVRHLKRDVMPQLQMPTYDLIHVEENGAVRAALKAEKLLDIDPDQLEGCDAETLGHVAVVRRMMGLAIAPLAAEYIQMLLDGGEEKLTVFGWHIEVLDILEKKLGKYGLVRIDGRTSGGQKMRLIEQFVKDRRIQIALGNLQSMGVGTDGLQHVSSHGLIVEPSWVHGDNEQAFDRLDRGGQRNAVQGDIFVAPGSFAEKVLAGALRKGQTTHKALDRRIA